MIWKVDMEAFECPDYRKNKEHHGFNNSIKGETMTQPEPIKFSMRTGKRILDVPIQPKKKGKTCFCIRKDMDCAKCDTYPSYISPHPSSKGEQNLTKPSSNFSTDKDVEFRLEKDKNSEQKGEALLIERRSHGCDGCRKDIPTERFDGKRGNHIWLCSKCFKKITGEKFWRESISIGR